MSPFKEQYRCLNVLDIVSNVLIQKVFMKRKVLVYSTASGAIVCVWRPEHLSPVISLSFFFFFSWEFVSLRVCGVLLSVCLACLSDGLLSHLSVCQRWVSERAVDELSVSGRVMGKNILLKKFSDLHEYSWGTYNEYHWENF